MMELGGKVEEGAGRRAGRLSESAVVVGGAKAKKDVSKVAGNAATEIQEAGGGIVEVDVNGATKVVVAVREEEVKTLAAARVKALTARWGLLPSPWK
jgi:hypothetical protein